MKIVIDARMWNETGIGRYIRNLVLGIEKIDTKNDYYLLLLAKEFKQLNLNPNFHKVLADFGWYSIQEQLKLPTLINKLSPDLFHSPNVNYPVFYNGKMIVTIHDLIMLKNFEQTSVKRYVKTTVLSTALKLLRRKNVTIITVSNFVKEQVSSKLKINKSDINVIYNAVDIDKNIVSAQSENGNYLLYVGNTYGHKNVKFLVESIKHIDRKLIIVGKEDKSILKLKEIVSKLGVDNLVTFKGYVDDTELASLYSNAFAFVFPTLEEGFGLPGLEAMSFNCPVVCTDINVLQEIYKDAALFFKPNHVDSLIGKLKLIENKEMREILTKKGAQVLKQYQSTNFVDQTLKVYNKLASYN